MSLSVETVFEDVALNAQTGLVAEVSRALSLGAATEVVATVAIKKLTFISDPLITAALQISSDKQNWVSCAASEVPPEVGVYTMQLALTPGATFVRARLSCGNEGESILLVASVTLCLSAQ